MNTPKKTMRLNGPDGADAPDAMLEKLEKIARQSGASDVAVISPQDILVEERLAGLCKDPQCESYGLSKTCPPHVPGPAAFREWLEESDYGVVVKIDVPTEILLAEESEDRREIMKLLHEIVSEMEKTAVSMGFENSRAFAGGSCKKLFCQDHSTCRMIDEGGKCRHPTKSRPSMSGFGVNVAWLVHSAGWAEDSKSAASSATWIAGLVLIS